MNKRKAVTLYIALVILMAVASASLVWFNYTRVRLHPAPFAPMPENLGWTGFHINGGGGAVVGLGAAAGVGGLFDFGATTGVAAAAGLGSFLTMTPVATRTNTNR